MLGKRQLLYLRYRSVFGGNEARRLFNNPVMSEEEIIETAEKELQDNKENDYDPANEENWFKD